MLKTLAFTPLPGLPLLTRGGLIALALAFIIFCGKVNAAPPMYVNDPDCLVSGVVKNIELRKNECGKHCQQCKDPFPTITDCEWLPPAEEYLTTIKVTKSINTQSAEDNAICANLYPAGEERLFSVSVDLFEQSQLKNGDTVSGNVARGGEFSSLQKERLNLPAAQKPDYSLLKNLLWLIGLILIAIAIAFIAVKKINKK